VKRGLFRDDGVDTLSKELCQVHNCDVFIPKDPKTLSIKECRAALEYLMFLKKKRCGKIKARGCTDGQKQRAYLSKEETSSPMVSTEALFLTCVIDAEEG